MRVETVNRFKNLCYKELQVSLMSSDWVIPQKKVLVIKSTIVVRMNNLQGSFVKFFCFIIGIFSWKHPHKRAVIKMWVEKCISFVELWDVWQF